MASSTIGHAAVRVPAPAGGRRRPLANMAVVGVPASSTSARAIGFARMLPPHAPASLRARALVAVQAPPWQCFTLRPLPQGHGSLRPARAAASRIRVSSAA